MEMKITLIDNRMDPNKKFIEPEYFVECEGKNELFFKEYLIEYLKNKLK